MRLMSFFLTTAQVRARRKFVTRREGWADLVRGQHFMAIVKGQGIPKGGKVERLCELVCMDNRPEVLRRMVVEPAYGKREAELEGFPEMTGAQFVAFYCKANGVGEDHVVNRILFEYA